MSLSKFRGPSRLVWDLMAACVAFVIGVGIVLVVRPFQASPQNTQVAKNSAAKSSEQGQASTPNPLLGNPPSKLSNSPPEETSKGQPKNESLSPPAPQPPAPPPSPNPAGFEGWVQDLEAAKRQAAEEKKDVLILFDGSDWCPHSIRQANEVFFHEAFREFVKTRFVLVLVDFPQGAARARVQDPDRNDRLAQEYQVEGYPTVFLTDAKGRPYAWFDGYQSGEAETYCAEMARFQKLRIRRDQLLDQVANGIGTARLTATKDAFSLLEGLGLFAFYEPLLEEWRQMAREQDPRNEQGFWELVFGLDWFFRIRSKRISQEDLAQRPGDLEEWRKTYHFRDPNWAAFLHVQASRMLVSTGHPQAALNLLKEGQKYKPMDPRMAQVVNNPFVALGFSTGTGFVVAAGGYLMTNHHVVQGPGRVFVALPGKGYIAAEVIAKEKRRDMALLRVNFPFGTSFPPLSLASGPEVKRGQEVAAFGYPLGGLVSSERAPTRGIIVATPDTTSLHVLVHDAKVNPGNSGGPLCDAFGQVVGLVTAKTRPRPVGLVESYGIAVPVTDLHRFLKENLKNAHRLAPPTTQRMTWEHVDQLVGPSVLMILQAPAQPAETGGARPAEARKMAPKRGPRSAPKKGAN
jgi:S1-C subfamily serine protease